IFVRCDIAFLFSSLQFLGKRSGAPGVTIHSRTANRGPPSESLENYGMLRRCPRGNEGGMSAKSHSEPMADVAQPVRHRKLSGGLDLWGRARYCPAAFCPELE